MDGAKEKADKLCDKILVFTVIDKKWDYRRIATFTLTEIANSLAPLESLTGSSAVTDAIIEINEMKEYISKLPN